jgi:hypothetical protein
LDARRADSPLRSLRGPRHQRALGERDIPATVAILLNLLVAKRLRIKDVERALPATGAAVC